MKKVVIVGYSGHAFVVIDTFLAIGLNLLGYFEHSEKENNPFRLPYLGSERKENSAKILREKDIYFFASIGNNAVRCRIVNKMFSQSFKTIAAIHPSAVISNSSSIGQGTFVAPGSMVNALSKIGKGVILNTSSVIEHECIIRDFVHIAPGAVLAGNVKIGEKSFVGANAVIKEGISIGKNVTIGAGAVIINDISDNETWVGNPGRKI